MITDNKKWINLKFLFYVLCSCRCVAKRYKTLVIIDVKIQAVSFKSEFGRNSFPYDGSDLSQETMFWRNVLNKFNLPFHFQHDWWLHRYSRIYSNIWLKCEIKSWTPHITNRVPTHKQIPILIPLFIVTRIPFSVNMEHTRLGSI